MILLLLLIIIIIIIIIITCLNRMTISVIKTAINMGPVLEDDMSGASNV